MVDVKRKCLECGSSYRLPAGETASVTMTDRRTWRRSIVARDGTVVHECRPVLDKATGHTTYQAVKPLNPRSTIYG